MLLYFMNGPNWIRVRYIFPLRTNMIFYVNHAATRKITLLSVWCRVFVVMNNGIYFGSLRIHLV